MNMRLQTTNYKLQTQKGFSLLELLIYVAVLAIVVGVLSTVFIMMNEGRGGVTARSAVNDTLNFAMDRIAQDLKLATSSAAITSPVAAGDSASTLTMTTSDGTVSYSVDSGTIRRSLDGAGEALTGDEVAFDTLTFTRIENTNTVLGKTFVSIKVDLTAHYNSSSPDWQYTQSKEIIISLR